AGIIFTVMIHALVTDTAFDCDEVEINAFGLHFTLAQWLQVIVFVAGDSQVELSHGISFCLNDQYSQKKNDSTIPISVAPRQSLCRSALTGCERSVRGEAAYTKLPGSLGCVS